MMVRRFARALIYAVPGECECCPTCRSPHLFDLDVIGVRLQKHLVTGFVSGCTECGLVFSNPAPAAEELAQMYSPSGDWGRPRVTSPVAARPAQTVDDVAPRDTSWSDVFLPIRGEFSVHAPPPGVRVLDFGCGNGGMLDRLQENGWETWGIEPSVGDAFPRHGRLTAVPPEPSFDLIIAHHVLEHVGDPLALLHQFAQAARPGAYLSVGVPRFDTLPDHRDYKYVINGHSHITAYTWPCLHGLLARSGWEPVGPPPDRVLKANGRLSSARIRVIARRVQAAPDLPAWPASSARLAMRRYHAGDSHRRLLGLRLLRLSARLAERRRQRDIQRRKAWKRALAASESRN